jgi:copper chaperone CopZ
MAKQVFSVRGMHCSACVMTLEGLEDELAGIRSLKVSLHKQRAEIDYDEKKITEDGIRRAFERAGYGLAPSLTP